MSRRHKQTIFRMVGYGDNAGSGFPDILRVWLENGWEKPALVEDTNLNQVTLILKLSAESSAELAESSTASAESSTASAESVESEAVLTARERQMLDAMDDGQSYSVNEMVELVGLQASRTRQLLNRLAAMGMVVPTAATKGRRYVKSKGHEDE